MKELLKQYHDAEQAIHEFFGFEPKWRGMPIEEHLDDHWMLFDDYLVAWQSEPWTEYSIESGKHYSGYGFSDKWIYRAGGFTMLSVDHNTDGNINLMIFSDANECTDKELKESYRECW